MWFVQSQVYFEYQCSAGIQNVPYTKHFDDAIPAGSLSKLICQCGRHAIFEGREGQQAYGEGPTRHVFSLDRRQQQHEQPKAAGCIISSKTYVESVSHNFVTCNRLSRFFFFLFNLFYICVQRRISAVSREKIESPLRSPQDSVSSPSATTSCTCVLDTNALAERKRFIVNAQLLQSLDWRLLVVVVVVFVPVHLIAQFRACEKIVSSFTLTTVLHLPLLITLLFGVFFILLLGHVSSFCGIFVFYVDLDFYYQFCLCMVEWDLSCNFSLVICV